MQSNKAKLIFELTFDTPEEIPEEYRDYEEEKYDLVGGTHINIRFEQDDLTARDLFPDDPQTFLENGVLAALAEQLIEGLHSERGTSFQYATEEAMKKKRDAEKALISSNILDALSAACLKSCEPGGNC